MPRDLYLRLTIPVPNHKGYRFHHSIGSLLKSAGWHVVTETRKFSYLKPPVDLAQERTADIKTLAPTDAEILAIAQDLHAAGVAARKMVNAFPVYYRPTSTPAFTSYKIDPDTGEKSLYSDQALQIPAAFRIGLWEVWEAEVYWNAANQPILVKRAHKEIPPPEPTLFDPPAEPVSPPAPLDAQPSQSAAILAPVPASIPDPFENDAEARQTCLAHHGETCQACDFNFTALYAGLGHGLIQVHHTPNSSGNPPDPITDLAPICPNCHALLHTTTPPLTIQTLRSKRIS